MDKLTFKDKLLLWVLPKVISPLLWILGKTIKIREEGMKQYSPHQKDKKEEYIYAFWHSKILLSVYFFRNFDINVLVSQSKDGEYIARIIHNFGFKTIRGSSSHGSLSAAKEMLKVAKTNEDIAITPDGPKGPKEIAQMGAAYIAKITGRTIVPYAFDASKKIVLNSWDNFIIPLPFSKGVFVWGEPIHVDRDTNEDILEEKRQELERSLKSLTIQASELITKKDK